ncbi:hypothetical protein HanPSC8_Chr17g0750041 [Helianthus annuus]|nr:hypothetical protein HanPSC8_Chr17g0750041 [Helianthus annuus]
MHLSSVLSLYNVTYLRCNVVKPKSSHFDTGPVMSCSYKDLSFSF